MDPKSKFILASGSPRRREVLGYFFNNIEVLKLPGFEEPVWQKGENPKNYMSRCVNAKWEEAFKRVGSGEFRLIVADTSVVLGSEVLGKPENDKDAVKMLSRLSGKLHTVYTAVMWGENRGAAKYRLFESLVTFKKLTKSQIEAYVRTGDPMDKAGAYGFQGLAIQFVQKVSGSYYSIMGLPAWPLFEELQK